MAWRCGSLSRSLISGATASTRRSSSAVPRLCPPASPIHGDGVQSRRLLSATISRSISGIIGCTQSLLPLHSAVAAARMTSHITVEARACCELSQGT